MPAPGDIAAKLEWFNARPLRDLDAASKAIANMNNPGLIDPVAETFGFAFTAEDNVKQGDGIVAIVPHWNSPTHLFHPYVDRWASDERGHATTLGEVLRRGEIEPVPGRPEGYVPPLATALGGMSRVSGWLHEVFEDTAATNTTMTEVETHYVYAALADYFGRNGEEAMRDEVLLPIAREEAAHEAPALLYAKFLREEVLDPNQLRLSRFLLMHGYSPVGAGSKADKERFGRALIEINSIARGDVEDPRTQAGLSEVIADIDRQLAEKRGRRKSVEGVIGGVARDMQRRAQELVGPEDGTPLRPFVHEALLKCARLGIQTYDERPALAA